MPTCPSCKETINELKVELRTIETGTVSLDKNNNLKVDIDFSDYEEDKYYCPICETEIFKDPEVFLKGE